MKNIAIIGGGPAGATIATLLSRKGLNVALFYNKEPEAVFVGESLIPAAMPVIEKLGIEEEMKAFSVYKPGATVWLDQNTMTSVGFEVGEGKIVSYAYQTERKQFDELLLKTARNSGVNLIKGTAEVEVNTDGTLALTQKTMALAAHVFNSQPDFIIDASGRKRLLANKLKLATTMGGRKDKALFAHVEGVTGISAPGNTDMHICENAWCWRIPLQNKTSIGVVGPHDYLKTLGKTSAEQFDNFLKENPRVAPFFTASKRVSEVQTYSNYQLATQKLYGKNWVLVGDAAGFLDPVFSSGLYLALTYANQVAEALLSTNANSLANYQTAWHKEISAWKKMIELWYSGRLFTTYKIGQDRLNTFVGRKIEPHVLKHFTRVFTGEAVHSTYSMGLLKFMCGPLQDTMKTLGMHKFDRKDLAI